MHIIKITSVSFKIILTEEDVKKYSENLFEDVNTSKKFFEDVIEETNKLYNCPFDGATVNAEFFESKNGGGELFLRATPIENVHNYCFKTIDSSKLPALCKRLSREKQLFLSKLYYLEGQYFLLLSFEGKMNKILRGVVGEYGRVMDVAEFFVWFLDEHAKVIFDKNAVINVVEKL